MLTLMGLLLPIAGCVAMGTLCARTMGRGGCHRGGLPAAQAAEAAELARLRAELTELRSQAETGADKVPTATQAAGGGW